jgi:hybrid cluster-associated redox disulfide protein
MIKPTDTIEELLENYPGINSYLMEHGIHCIKCGEPVWATLEELIREKRLDLDKILNELNRRFTSKKQK